MARRSGRRHRDWETPEKGFLWEHVVVEVLMDIREELRIIRELAQCGNVRKGFIAMQKIDKRMAKKFPLK